MDLREQRYKSASGCGSFVVVILLLALGTAASIQLIRLLPNRAENWIATTAWGIMIGIGLITAVCLAVVMHRMAKASARRLAAALAAEGFVATLEPTPEELAPLQELLQPIAMFEGGNIQWFARSRSSAGDALIVQHSHITGSGKSTHEHFRTIVAWPTNTPNVPWLWMRRPKAGKYRLSGTPDVPDVLVGDAAFDKAFLIQCPGHPDAPRHLLTPEIRAFILAGPKRESWVIARGYTACIFHNNVKADALLTMLRRARTLAGMWTK